MIGSRRLNFYFGFFFIAAFLIVLFYTKYVSLASVSGITAVFFYILFTAIVEVALIVFIICVIIIVKHKSNFNRIGNGNEPKIGELKHKNG